MCVAGAQELVVLQHKEDIAWTDALDAVRTARRTLERDREHRALGEGSAAAS